MNDGYDLQLPAACLLRPANANDLWSIRRLVFGAKLDPTQICWQQFWVIESINKVVACAQLRNFTDAQELGSLVVCPEWRGKGLGRLLTKHLISQATQPLYLECLGKRLVDFYRPSGFITFPFEQLPRSLQNKFRLSQLGKIIIRLPVNFMHYPENY